MRIWGMRLLVHRGQVPLLLAVGLVTGVAIAGVCMQMNGASILAALRVNQVFAPPGSKVPAQIVIGRAAPGTARTSTVLGDPVAARAVPSVAPVAPAVPADPAAPPASAGPVYPSPTTARVPTIVYTYSPDEHGGGPGGGGSDGGGSPGGGSPPSPSPSGHH